MLDHRFRSTASVKTPLPRGVDTDEHSDLAAEAGVRSIPTVAIYRDGEEVERFVGVTGADEIWAALN